MAKMASAERIDTAIRLGKPDRVPVVPSAEFFAARYAGITQHEMFFDMKKFDFAMSKMFDDFGPVDGVKNLYAGIGRSLLLAFPVPPMMPGIAGQPDDGQFQFIETAVMEPEEYSVIAERGAARWIISKLRAHNPNFAGAFWPLRVQAWLTGDTFRLRRFIAKWKKRGVVNLMGCNYSYHPMEYLSFNMRSCEEFMLDLFRYPDEVKAACRALVWPLRMFGMASVLTSGVRRVFIGGIRTSASFISPRQFEEFALPLWLETCDFFLRHGVTPILHFDCDWTPMLRFLKEFPRGKCILSLDGTTDIFKAKEELEGHMCIMGDVPAAMLKLAEPEEVDEYCGRLITELGESGGFILGSGCTMPPDAKPENVKAMFRSVDNYGSKNR